VCVLALLAVGAFAAKGTYSGKDLEHVGDLEAYSFEEFVTDFEKTYESPEEYRIREEIFNANKATIMAHNSRKDSGYKMAINFLADRKPKELKRYRGHSKAKALSLRSEMTAALDFHADVAALPASVDWRTHNPPVVTPVKDQGSCGSCWAHAATEEIESFLALKTGKLVELSRQNILECSPNPNECGGTGGCEGATAEIGMGYVQAKGVATEAAYPYTAQDGTCNENIPKTATISGFVALPTNNYTALLTAIATAGPVAISVDASAWSFYSSGVFDGCSFSSVDIDHAVQLVGYGHDASVNMDYWIVRNSWSAGWGESGYIRLRKHSDGDLKKWCGIDYAPADGSGCANGPAQVVACGTCGIWFDNSLPLSASFVH